jgi:hypothetical protein
VNHDRQFLILRMYALRRLHVSMRVRREVFMASGIGNWVDAGYCLDRHCYQDVKGMEKHDCWSNFERKAAIQIHAAQES